jgi:glycosyltransferase involved in cell wall biosynthesis
MRIGIDARELSDKPTGVGRYLGGLLREWTASTATHVHEFVLYSHRPVSWPAGRCEVRQVPGSGGTLWEQRALPQAIDADGVEVLFSPAYSTPLFTRVPRVVALHDISFAARPEWFTWREGLRRRVLARRAAAAAKTVVTISEFSKSEILARFGTPASRVRVIPPGIDAPPASTEVGDSSVGAHVLYVGSIFNRRHIPELIAAFTRVASRHRDAELHMVGDNRSYPHEDVRGLIARSPAASRMHWHQYVPDGELQQLYRGARAFVFLSEYEGLGLTPLEALAAGIPSLLLDTPVARESCGSAALYVPLGNIDVIASELERLLYDEATRRSLLTAAPATLARYDWPRAARETLRVLEEAR